MRQQIVPLRRPRRCPVCGCPPGLARLRVSTVAAALGVSPSTIRRLCEVGDLDAVKVRGAWAIAHASLDAYCRARSPRAQEGILA